MCRILDLFRMIPIELLQLPIKIDHEWECSKRWKFREKVTRSGRKSWRKDFISQTFSLKLTEERRMSYFFHLPRSFEKKKPFFKVKNAENFSTKALVVKNVLFAIWRCTLALWQTKTEVTRWLTFTDSYWHLLTLIDHLLTCT